MNFNVILGIVLIIGFFLLGGADLIKLAFVEGKKLKDELSGKIRSQTEKRAEKIQNGVSKSG